MTRAPECLMEPRRLLIHHLDRDPSKSRHDDLESNEVGIVGDSNHIGGYHCGSNRIRKVNGVVSDYSVNESGRDKVGLTDLASALDVGWFQVVVNGKTHNLYTFNRWVVAECEKGAPDTLDIREIIYTLDGKTVLRWDRLKLRSTGDGSHRTHTHFSIFRDATKAGRDVLTSLFRRYLTHIGLLEGVDMSTEYPKAGDEHAGVSRVMYLLNRVGIKTPNPNLAKDHPDAKKPVALTVDGVYGKHMTAAVLAFELSVNPKYTGKGTSVTAATRMRLDEAYVDLRVSEGIKLALAQGLKGEKGDKGEDGKDGVLILPDKITLEAHVKSAPR